MKNAWYRTMTSQDFGLVLLCPKRLIPVTNHLYLPVPQLTHFSRGPWSYAARVAQFGLSFLEVGIGSTGEVKGLCVLVRVALVTERLVCPTALVSRTRQQSACWNSNCYSKDLMSDVANGGNKDKGVQEIPSVQIVNSHKGVLILFSPSCQYTWCNIGM